MKISAHSHVRPCIVGVFTGRALAKSVPAVRSIVEFTGRRRHYATETSSPAPSNGQGSSSAAPSSSSGSFYTSSGPSTKSIEPIQMTENSSLPPGWEDETSRNIAKFSELPHRNFGFNQHMLVNAEFKEALRQVLWQFRAPIRYAFAYGSGVFSQGSKVTSSEKSPHPNAPEAVVKWQRSGGKSIDFIFGVSYSQHWHSLNLQQHRNHYSFLGSLGSSIVTKVQENIGAGVYFNTYVIVNGIMIKYGVVNLDTMYRDLSEWNTLYFAGRLHKPVKILRDDPRIRLANQKNLISALRTALLMLPPKFTEQDLYTKIASISYIGDPRMTLRAENPRKVADIVDNQMVNFRQLYLPLIDDLPNLSFNDAMVKVDGWIDSSKLNCRLEQDMDPQRRGNMVRRLPKSFRQKLYQQYQREFKIPWNEFSSFMEESHDDTAMSSHMGTELDKKIAASQQIEKIVSDVVKQTVTWPSATQSLKGLLTAGPWKGLRYFGEKLDKGRAHK